MLSAFFCPQRSCCPLLLLLLPQKLSIQGLQGKLIQVGDGEVLRRLGYRRAARPAPGARLVRRPPLLQLTLVSRQQHEEVYVGAVKVLWLRLDALRANEEEETF